MEKKTINIAGKQVGIAYCYATEITFKRYTDKSVEEFDATNPEHVLYLILSAIMPYYLSRDEEVPVTADELMYQSSPEELIDALKEVLSLRNAWYKLPEGEPTDEPTEETEGDKKNA